MLLDLEHLGKALRASIVLGNQAVLLSDGNGRAKLYARDGKDIRRLVYRIDSTGEVDQLFLQDIMGLWNWIEREEGKAEVYPDKGKYYVKILRGGARRIVMELQAEPFEEDYPTNMVGEPLIYGLLDRPELIHVLERCEDAELEINFRPGGGLGMVNKDTCWLGEMQVLEWNLDGLDHRSLVDAQLLLEVLRYLPGKDCFIRVHEDHLVFEIESRWQFAIALGVKDVTEGDQR